MCVCVSWRVSLFILAFFSCILSWFEDKTNGAKQVMFQPRGRIARAIYLKQISDGKLGSIDKSKWYCLRNKELIQDEVANLFIQMALDEETQDFLDLCTERSDWVFTQLWYSFAEIFLAFFLTRTSINGLLGRGSMFVYSTDQFKQFLNIQDETKFGSLLDIGAGDGATTQRMAGSFDRVSVTEISPPMRWALAKKHFRVLELNDWMNHRFDVVSCLNVLDRCDSPLTLIEHMKSALNPGGALLIAIVLPYTPYVETNKTFTPSERLPLTGKTAEEQVDSFATDFVRSLGLKVVRWTRLPYISEGDIHQSYYWLDDYLFLLVPTS